MPTLNLTQHSRALAAGLDRLQSKADIVSARVSSGHRIDRPSADIAGVGVAAKLHAQQERIRGVHINLQNGASRMQVTVGQLNTISKIVSRLSEIGVLNSNATQDATSRSLYQVEFTQLQDQLRDMIGGTTAEIGGTADVQATGTFNGSRLFGPGPGETFTIGLQTDERLTLPVLDLSGGAIGALIRQDASGAYVTNLQSAGINTTASVALTQTTTALANVGSVQSRLDFSANVASTASANNEAALSVIQDADVAKDVTEKSRLQLLTDAHGSMLAQARDATSKLIALLSR